MRFRRGCSILSVCWLALAAAGCMAGKNGLAGEGPLPVTVLNTGRQCAASGEGWRAVWIASSEALREWSAECRANVIQTAPVDVPEVDFSRFAVLAVEMGRQSSAGYGFDADGVKGHVAGRTATVAVESYRPGPGAMTAQVITSPWILIQLPLGRYDAIRVVDKDARLLVQIERP